MYFMHIFIFSKIIIELFLKLRDKNILKIKSVNFLLPNHIFSHLIFYVSMNGW